ncbi:DNA glycosylase [Trametes maxima]|nr:DNA glycosylase [Trametes maxima]
MAVTRSATRSTSGDVNAAGTDKKAVAAVKKPAATSRKRKTTDSEPPQEGVQKKAKPTNEKNKAKATKASPPVPTPAPESAPSCPFPPPSSSADGEELVPAVLTFSFEHAKQHLISADPRFEELFRRVKCKPFEHLERVDPFRTLAHSILGQQISWKAAASITHRFVRLFDPSIPESLAESKSNFFPSAHQVVTKDIATLRTAGLSGRKAEYVLDLAARFADGRLSTRKLLVAEDEELYAMLTAVRGIGRWTVDMFAMFSLRRPDILPVGDLGVQRGALRWFVSLHSPSHPVSLRKDKLIDQVAEEPVAGNAPPSTEVEGESRAVAVPRAATPDASSIPPAPESLLAPPSGQKGKEKAEEEPPLEAGSGMALPDPFTPSINKTLNMKTAGEGGEYLPPPLPEGLTLATMKSRLSGKKVKGALLTPKEMEELTECWRPYRSLGVYYMWALAEESK